MMHVTMYRMGENDVCDRNEESWSSRGEEALCHLQESMNTLSSESAPCQESPNHAYQP